MLSLSRNPQPGGPVHLIYTPQDRVTQLYPQAPDTHFSRLVRRVGYFGAWFQALTVFCMLYAFFWVITRRLEFICQL